MSQFKRFMVLLGSLLAAIVSPQADPPTRDAVPTAAEIAERFRDKVNSAEKKIVIEMTEDVTYYDLPIGAGDMAVRTATVASEQARSKGKYYRIQIVTIMTMTPTSLVSEIFRHDISDQPVTILRITENKGTGFVGSAEVVQSDGTTKTKIFNLSSRCDEDWVELATMELGNPATAGLPASCGANIEAWFFWQDCWADDLATQIFPGEVKEVTLNGRKTYRVYGPYYNETDEKGQNVYYGSNTYFLDAETGLMVRKENSRTHNRIGEFQFGVLITRTYEWDIPE